MGDVDAAIASTLQSTEQTRSSRSTLETNVKVRLERPWGIFFVGNFGMGESAIGFCDAFVFICQSKLVEGTASAEEASGVCCLYSDKTHLFIESDTYRQPS